MWSSLAVVLSLAVAAKAHSGVWTDGMYCRGGNDPSKDDQNTNLIVNPLYDLPKSQWWMQADRGCDKVPPPEGEFLNIPAGAEFTVEIGINRAFTTLSYDGRLTTQWPDGEEHPEDWHSPSPTTCLNDNPDGSGGALHTHNFSTTAGTAWAISYESDISKVTLENLVVFSVAEHTPWKRLATYQVPADLPACPEGGCYCAWLWVPDGCGQPNMYMQNFKCNVTSVVSTKKLGVAQVPLPCRGDASKCVSGPKQMIAWNQAEGNNVPDIGYSPGYNANMGYLPGRQNDIFVEGDTVPDAPAPAPTTTPSSTIPASMSQFLTTSTSATLPSETTGPGTSTITETLATSTKNVSTSPDPTTTISVTISDPAPTPAAPSQSSIIEAPNKDDCKRKRPGRRPRRAHRAALRN